VWPGGRGCDLETKVVMPALIGMQEGKERGEEGQTYRQRVREDDLLSRNCLLGGCFIARASTFTKNEGDGKKRSVEGIRPRTQEKSFLGPSDCRKTELLRRLPKEKAEMRSSERGGNAMN